MEKATPFNRTQLINWTVAEFKYNLGYLSWESEIERKYFDLKKK